MGRDSHCTSLRPGVEDELKERWEAELRQQGSSDHAQQVCAVQPTPNQGLEGMREGCPGEGAPLGPGGGGKARVQGGARGAASAGAQVPRAGSQEFPAVTLLHWCCAKQVVTEVQSDCKAAGQQGLLLCPLHSAWHRERLRISGVRLLL